MLSGFNFAWPLALLSLLVVPALIAWYLWMLQRRRKYAVVSPTLTLLAKAAPSRPRWQRHLPFALLIAALASLGLATARPQAEQDVPQNRTSIILAMDVSRSMCATDIEPNRLSVAQDAARTFIQEQAGNTNVGLVAFAGTARIIVAPTSDADVLIEAIDSFRTAFGTTIGSAQLKALDAIAEVNDNVAPTAEDLDAPAVPAVAFEPDVVVLLTDGANSGGPDPIVAAEAAAARRVRVFTIGFGTDEPTEMICGNTQIGADTFGNGSFGSDGVGGDSFGGITGSFGGGGGRGGSVAGAPRQLLVIDEPTLQAIAEITGGAYFRAADANQLVDVFASLPTEIELQTEQVEIASWFTALALAFTLAALAWTIKPFRRAV